MKLLITILLCFLVLGCTSKEVRLAEIQLESQKLQTQERKDLRDAELIKEINAPKELLVLKGCGTSCEATLYNPFHETKLPTNEHDVAINRDNRIAETVQGVVPAIVTGKVLSKSYSTLESIAVAAVQGAGHNTSITGQNTSISEDNDSTSTSNSADGNTSLTAGTDILQDGSTKRQESDDLIAGQDIKQQSDNPVNTDTGNDKSVVTNTTEIKEEEKADDAGENNP